MKEKLGLFYTVEIYFTTSVEETSKLASQSDFVVITNLWASGSNDYKGAGGHTFTGKKLDQNNFEFYNETYNSIVTSTIGGLFRDDINNNNIDICIPLCIITIKKQNLL